VFKPQKIATLALISTIGLTMSQLPSQAIPFNPPKPKTSPKPKAPKLGMMVEEIAPPAPQPIAEPEVKSKQNLDYERLQSLMKEGEWAEANQLTSLIMLNLGDKSGKGYLNANDTAKLSCTELKTVDGLWSYYTGGRSSFTMQARIWRNMWGDNAKDAKKFEGRVGWHKSSLNPEPKTAQAGHMPLRPSGDGGSFDTLKGGWMTALADRLQTCGMIAPQRTTQKLNRAKTKTAKMGTIKRRSLEK
jgi:hypothetical protein